MLAVRNVGGPTEQILAKVLAKAQQDSYQAAERVLLDSGIPKPLPYQPTTVHQMD